MIASGNIVDSVKRSSNDFSFLATLESFICNNEFKEGLMYLNRGKNNQYGYIWTVLSAIGQDVGDTIYENVVHYIDRVSNIDLCKTQSLGSMLKSFGIQYSVIDNVKLFPIEIRDIIDVMSINRRYLLDTNILKTDTVKDLSVSLYHTAGTTPYAEHERRISGYSEEEIKTPGYILNSEYNDYLSSVMFNLISSMVNMPYNNDDDTPIWKVDEKEIVENIVTDDTEEDINLYKRQHNIPASFDHVGIVDAIDNGTDSIDNYEGYRKEVIQLEIDKRASVLKGYEDELKTRYSYYRKQKVKEYIDMVETQYNGFDNLSSIETEEYRLDGNYLLVHNRGEQQRLIDIKTARLDNEYQDAVNYDMIKVVSGKISQIILYIANIRDIIKIQAQKNYMKGTFNLLAYLVNEYLIEFSNSSVFEDPEIVQCHVRDYLKQHSFNAIDLIEYIDTTEYFNISGEMSNSAVNGDRVNSRYWEDDIDQNTNTGYAFTDSQISAFYMQKLNCQDKVDDMDDFMNALFEIGAQNSYVDSESGDLMVQGDLSTVTNYNGTIMLSYMGSNVGYNPYLNHKNITHPSFQIHPFLKNFIEYQQYNQVIANAFNNNTVEETTYEQALNILSSKIGQYGQTIGIATNSLYDYSGYMSRYESTDHNGKYTVYGYDGAFYPPAAYDFMNDPDTCIDQLMNMSTNSESKTFYDNYYSDLELTQEQCIHIASQLSVYKNDIIDIIEDKSQQSSVYDIYKYTRDKYDNMYILYKRYGIDNPSYQQKKDTTGQLWIRLKNHPIAFPAIYGKIPQIDQGDTFNDNFQYLAQISCTNVDTVTDISTFIHNQVDDNTKMSYIYDIDLAQGGGYIMCAVDSINDISGLNGIPAGLYSDIIKNGYYRGYQFADIVISQIYEDFDEVDNYTKLYFKSANPGRITRSPQYVYAKNDYRGAISVDGESFLGFYRNGYTIGPVYIEKTMIKEDEDTVDSFYINNKDIRFSYIQMIDGTVQQEYNRMPIQLRDCDSTTNGYYICDGDVVFSYNGDRFTFGFLTRSKTDNLKVQNYPGMEISGGIANYDTQTSSDASEIENDSEYNSFDRFDQFVTVIDTQFINGAFTLMNQKQYNLNGDASYIPSYPGKNGKMYIDQTVYNDDSYKCVELLGRSNNGIYGYINSINPTADPNVDISQFKKEAGTGMTWEDWDESDDVSLIQFRYSQRIDSPNSYYKQLSDGTVVERDKTGNLDWNIALDDYGISANTAMNEQVIMFNTENYGKNPYFVGSLSSLINGISLKEYGTYTGDKTNREIISQQTTLVKATGTYNFTDGRINDTEDNYLYNVADIYIKYNQPENKIKVIFYAADINKIYFIKDKTICLTLCNVDDLRIFAKYHYLDHVNRGNDSSSISAINGQILSTLNFQDYHHLSDIPALSGLQGLDFKILEQDVFDLSSPYYYFPSLNTVYPLRGVNFFNSQDTGSEYNTISYDDIFNNDNLFIMRLDDGSLVNKIGKVELPIQYNDSECLRVDESWIVEDSDGVLPSKKYDTTNAHILEYVRFNDNQSTENEFVFRPNETLDEATERIATTMNLYAQSGEYLSDDYQGNFVTYTPSYHDLDGIDDVMNLYVNYAENDGKITLFFNYYNYINTPFIKIVNGQTKLDIIDGTYLKLGPGENGILDVVCQFKIYLDSSTIQGVKNVKMASYRIYNISDDKPKFLIYKTSEVQVGSAKHVPTRGEAAVYVTGESINLDKLMESGTITETSQVPINIGITFSTNKILSSAGYDIVYPDNYLNPPDGYTAYKPGFTHLTSIYDTTLTFKTKYTYSELTGMGIDTKRLVVYIKNPELYDTDGLKFKTRTGAATVSFTFNVYLRQESNYISDYVITEQNSDSNQIEI